MLSFFLFIISFLFGFLFGGFFAFTTENALIENEIELKRYSVEMIDSSIDLGTKSSIRILYLDDHQYIMWQGYKAGGIIHKEDCCNNAR